MDISGFKIKFQIVIFLLLLSGLNTAHNVYSKPDQATVNSSNLVNTAELISEESLTDSVQVQAAKATEKQREIFGCRWEDNEFEVGLKNRVEIFYSKNCALFSGSPQDQVLWAQGIWDLKAKAKIGKTLESYLVLRNKSRWGSPDSIATTSNTPIKLADATFGDHGHYISKQIFWLREGWVDINLNNTIGVSTEGVQHFKAGLFPFELGRGIALGSAYASSAGLLGFYADSTVDQNAPGFLLYGDLAKDQVFYDMYLGILRNWTDNFGRVNEKIYANELNPSGTGTRGFGHVNFVYAMRVKWYPMSVKQGDHSTLVIEPYFLFNRNPEVTIEFPSDSASSLITPGLMVDYEGEKFQWGCEFAANFGHQTVHGWDSNQIEIKADSSGALVEQYTKIYSNSDLTTNALVSSANKTIVKNYACNNPDLNGQQINSTGLYNGATRFNPKYRNIYKGFMLVADLSWLITKALKLSGTVGWATGDENPNRDLSGFGDSSVDGDYQGFIGLQEVYSGKRVISLFVIGSNSIARPLSSASDPSVTGTYPSKVTGFNNILYCGGALNFDKKFCSKAVNWNLGLLSYWQDFATKKFSIPLKSSIDEPASRHLGVEFNATLTMQFVKNLKGFLVSGVFVPGKHYQDIKGKALSKDDLAALEKLDDDGFSIDGTPLLNTKTAFVLNWGIEYAF
jgi:hypothetical protein